MAPGLRPPPQQDERYFAPVAPVGFEVGGEVGFDVGCEAGLGLPTTFTVIVALMALPYDR